MRGKQEEDILKCIKIAVKGRRLQRIALKEEKLNKKRGTVEKGKAGEWSQRDTQADRGGFREKSAWKSNTRGQTESFGSIQERRRHGGKGRLTKETETEG